MRHAIIGLLAAATLLGGCITTERERHRKRIGAAEPGPVMLAAADGATIARAKH